MMVYINLYMYMPCSTGPSDLSIHTSAKDKKLVAMAPKAVRFDLRMKHTLAKIDMDKKKPSVTAIKSTKGISKSHIAKALSAKCGHKQKDMVKVLDALMEIATEEVKTHGKFTIPGIVMVKKRYKPGRSAGKVMLIGKQYDVKAKAGHNVIKAFVINPLKSNVQ